MRRRCAAAAAAVLGAVLVCAAQSADPPNGGTVIFRGMASASMEASVHSWRAGGDLRIVQQTFPMNIALPVAERALFTITAVPASVSKGGGSIGGVPETRFGASYVLPGEKVWLTGGVSMPTGATKLTAEQTAIAASIAHPALGFPMPSMGHGFNTTLGCAYASNVTRLIVFGFGAAISTKGSYEPVAPSGASSMTYAPGDEIAANIGIDCRDGMKTNRLSADYTVTYYASDRLNGERFFQSGIKASLVVVGTHAARELVHTVSLRLETRAHNVTLAGGEEQETPSARRLSAAYMLTLAVRTDLSVAAGAEFRTMTSDEFPVSGEVISTGGGTVAALSAECRYAPAAWCIVTPRCSYGFGSITMVNSTMHAAGFDAGVGIKFLL
jgi:hypothetical protein